MIRLQSTIYNQCLPSKPLQLRTYHFILLSRALRYRLRLAVRIPHLTIAFRATELISATSEDLIKPISYSVALSQPCPIPAPSSDAPPRQPSTLENETTAVPGEVEWKGTEAATHHPKDVQMCELLFVHHWTVSDSHFSARPSCPPARNSF